jgi:hypothetical protein
MITEIDSHNMEPTSRNETTFQQPSLTERMVGTKMSLIPVTSGIGEFNAGDSYSVVSFGNGDFGIAGSAKFASN